MGLYSVYRNNKWHYYNPVVAHATVSGKSSLTGQAMTVKKKEAIEHLGLVPEEACYCLPPFSIHIGEGDRPMGRIAAGPPLSATIGKLVVGGGVALLVWYLTHPKPASNPVPPEEQPAKKKKARKKP